MTAVSRRYRFLTLVGATLATFVACSSNSSNQVADGGTLDASTPDATHLPDAPNLLDATRAPDATNTPDASDASNQDVTITWSDVKQHVDGFGASAVFYGGSITDDMADSLFDAKKGLGLSLLRIQIGLPADTQSDGSEPTTGAKPVATVPEIATAKQAIARGCKVWAAAWTPPPIWKTTNNKDGSKAPPADAGSGDGGSGDGGSADGGVAPFSSNKLLPAHYQDYANYLAAFLQLTTGSGVPIFALSPANEPDYVATWDNAQWSPDELTTFIDQNLGPTLGQSWPGVRLIAPETSNCPKCDPYVTSILADPMAANDVPILAVHGYTSGGALVYDKPQQAGKAFWETEWSQENLAGDTPDPTMTSAIDMANHIHNYMVTTGVNAWNWWAIYYPASGLTDPQRMNPAFIQPDQSLGTPYMFKRGYAFGNWSKFVRPGFVRIGATDLPVPGVLVEAYRDATHLAVIAVNTTSSTVTQTFHLAGQTFGTLTPWVTSADDSLVAKSTIAASDQFTFDLPATSVVTFVNWDATTETPGQLPSNVMDGGPEAGPSDAGDAGLFTSPCVASAAGITLIDDGSSGVGTTVSYSPPFTPAGCGRVGSWGEFATNSGTIVPNPFVYSPLPPGIPADAGVTGLDASMADASGNSMADASAETGDDASAEAGDDGSTEAGDDGSTEAGDDGGDDASADAAGDADAGGAAPTGPQAVCLSGATGVTQYSTSGVGFNLVQQTAVADGGLGSTPLPATLDASSHAGIQFWAWGGSEIAAQSVFVVLRDINQTSGFGPAGTPTATGQLCNGGTDGVGSGPTACGGDRVSQTIMSGWQLVRIPFTSFVPISGYSSGNGETVLDPSTLTRFELQVQEASATAEAGVPYDLCIFGLSFY
jgi:glucuronoarabinoxylan endo-1,4-beta-xylanase